MESVRAQVLNGGLITKVSWLHNPSSERELYGARASAAAAAAVAAAAAMYRRASSGWRRYQGPPRASLSDAERSAAIPTPFSP